MLTAVFVFLLGLSLRPWQRQRSAIPVCICVKFPHSRQAKMREAVAQLLQILLAQGFGFHACRDGGP
jgi:hypothetical protein